ncbi:MAG: hypothetical protein IKT00_04985 [Prevotella sp.]|nr:hypothetical protein [Prevotella sp.]
MSIVISLILFVAAIAYVEWRLKSVNRSNDEADKHADHHFATKKDMKDYVEKTAKQRQIDLQNIDDRIASIEQRIFFTDNPAPKRPVEQMQPETKKDVFYFRWPAEDGSFNDAEREMVASENTYYEFHLLSPTEAEFTFKTISETQLSKANNSSKKYIERACTFSTAKSTRYSCQPGKAILKNGRWAITQKAVIEYQ